MLEALKTRFQQLAEAVTGPPSRDALALERDQLLAAVPPAPENTMEAPEEPSCSCEHCLSRFDEEQRRRLAYGAWAGRLGACERGLVSLTWGDETQRDAPGTALAELCGELIRAFDTVKARGWERRVEYDARGRETAAWETAPALGDVLADLVGLHRTARERLLFLSTFELLTAIETTRAQMGAALVRPLERPLTPEVATRAGTTTRPASEAERHGLVVAPGPDKSVLSGTVRCSRRDRFAVEMDALDTQWNAVHAWEVGHRQAVAS